MGSVVLLTDASGAVTAEYKYLPFGEATHAGNANSNLTFTNQEADSESSLMYYNARYYNPELGRFMNRDINRRGDVLTHNDYVYTRNNPFKYTDPSGEFEEFLKGVKRGARGAQDFILETTNKGLQYASGSESREEYGDTLIALSQHRAWNAAINNPKTTGLITGVGGAAAAAAAPFVSAGTYIAGSINGGIGAGVYAGFQKLTGQPITTAGLAGSVTTGTLTGGAGNVAKAFAISNKYASKGILIGSVLGSGAAGNSVEQFVGGDAYSLSDTGLAGASNVGGYIAGKVAGAISDEAVSKIVNRANDFSGANYLLKTGISRWAYENSKLPLRPVTFSAIGYQLPNQSSEAGVELLYQYTQSKLLNK